MSKSEIVFQMQYKNSKNKKALGQVQIQKPRKCLFLCRYILINNFAKGILYAKYINFVNLDYSTILSSIIQEKLPLLLANLY